MADFSILLPTRNRAAWAKVAVQSCLAQTHADFELVVADNDDTDETTQAVRSFADRRIKHVRTGGLGMVDNWNAALSEASEEIIVVIEDKIVLAPWCLERLKDVFSQSLTSPFVTWCIKPVTTYVDFAKSSASRPSNPQRHLMCSSEVLDWASRCRFDVFQRVAPRAINTAVRRSFLENSQKKAGTFFRPMNPDYNFAFRALACSETFLHFNDYFSGVLIGAPSNGAEVSRRDSSAKVFFTGLKKSENECLDAVPVKIPVIPNFMLNDYIHFVQSTGNGSEPHALDYCAMLIAELVVMDKQGTPIADLGKQLSDYIDSQGPRFRLRLLAQMTQMFAKGWPNRRLKMRHNAKDFIRALRICLAGR